MELHTEKRNKGEFIWVSDKMMIVKVWKREGKPAKIEYVRTYVNVVTLSAALTRIHLYLHPF